MPVGARLRAASGVIAPALSRPRALLRWAAASPGRLQIGQGHRFGFFDSDFHGAFSGFLPACHTGMDRRYPGCRDASEARAIHGA